jgi:hypothetical protein
MGAGQLELKCCLCPIACEPPAWLQYAGCLNDPPAAVLKEQCIFMRTILLLIVSNIFMTFAWYGHLKFKSSPLWKVILISWFIAFVEYCFQVPANRIGHYEFSAAQLKTIQEVITLVVFAVFSITYLREDFKWNYLVGFAMIIAAVFFIFKKW